MGSLGKITTKIQRTNLCVVGAAGDLSQTRLIPAAVALSQLIDRELQVTCIDIVPFTNKVGGFDYIQLKDPSFDSIKAEFARLAAQASDSDDIIIYLATPPSAFLDLVTAIGETHQAATDRLQILIEKPFACSEQELEELADVSDRLHISSCLLFVDHYLFKHSVQDLFILLRENLLFRSLWNRDYIESVTFTCVEEQGVDERGEFFERMGLIRDVFQSHILQLIWLVTGTSAFDQLRSSDEFDNVVLKSAKDIRLGQYGAGPRGEPYRRSKGVNNASQTETYVSMTLFVENERWTDVPIYVMAGKGMAETKSEILIKFRRMEGSDASANEIRLSFKHQDSLSITLNRRSHSTSYQSERGEFELVSGRPGVSKLTDYASLLHSAIHKDRRFFVSRDQARAAWRITEKILKARCNGQRRYFPNYARGSDSIFEQVERSTRFATLMENFGDRRRASRPVRIEKRANRNNIGSSSIDLVKLLLSDKFGSLGQAGEIKLIGLDSLPLPLAFLSKNSLMTQMIKSFYQSEISLEVVDNVLLKDIGLYKRETILRTATDDIALYALVSARIKSMDPALAEILQSGKLPIGAALAASNRKVNVFCLCVFEIIPTEKMKRVMQTDQEIIYGRCSLIEVENEAAFVVAEFVPLKEEGRPRLSSAS